MLLSSPALVCQSSSMRAALDRRYLELQGYSVWNVSLPDSACRPTITAAEVAFSIPYNGCGTRREVGASTAWRALPAGVWMFNRHLGNWHGLPGVMQPTRRHSSSL